MAKSKGKGKMKQAMDAELFAVDDTGDETLRRQVLSSTWDAPAAAHARRGSGRPLKSAEILAMRSRVPALTSKVVPGIMVQQKKEAERKGKIDPQVKRRLRSMVRRDNAHDRGLWDVTVGPSNAAAPLSQAVEAAGSHDVWDAQSSSDGRNESTNEYIDGIVIRSQPKAPSTLHAHQLLSKAAAPAHIPAPHPGQSYNPTYEDHQALLAAEHARVALEEQKAREAEEARQKIMRGASTVNDAYETGYAGEVGSGDEDSADEGNAGGDDGEEGEDALKKKTKKQRRKTTKEKKRRAANIALDAQLRAQSRLTKAQRQTLAVLPKVVGSIEEQQSISLSQLHRRKTELARKLAEDGLADLRSGPSRVPKPKQAYLLSEELPETLRHLKTDGNLWNDWLDSSRRRGKVQMERRAYGRMVKQKRRGLKDVEKATWRMFKV